MLIDILPTDAYNNSQELEDSSAWSTGSSAPIVPLSVIGSLAVEKWMLPQSAFVSRVLNQPLVSLGDARYEHEIHFLYHFTTQVTGSSATIAYLKNAASTSGEGLELLVRPSAAGAGAPSVLAIAADDTGPSVVTNFEDYPVVAGSTFHVVMRTSGQTPANSDATALSDGRMEIFINGNRVFFRNDVDWGTSDADRHWTSSAFTVGTGISNQSYIRDVFFYDAWTTAYGTAPTPEILTPAVLDSIGGLYTNEGGAVDEITALTDGVDTTFLKSDSAASELELGFSVDPAVASLPVSSVMVLSKVSRDTAAFNNIEVELQDAAGVTVLGTEVVPVSAISPAKQAVLKQIIPSSAINADDFSVVIRNGS